MMNLLKFYSPSHIKRWCLALLLVTSLLPACSELNGTRLEPVLGGDINLVNLGDSIAEKFVLTAYPPLLPRQAEQPVLVATLVDNDDLDKTSAFGRSLQNSIIAGLVGRGYAASEVKLRPNLVIQEERGEFMLSRDLNEIAGQEKAQAVVVGTYTMTNRMMYLSVRLVSPNTRTIRATYEDRLYLDKYSLELLGKRYAGHKEKGAADVELPTGSLIDEIFY